MKNFELQSFANADELARTVAGAWLDEITAANQAGKVHYVALSGGRITQKLFASVVEQATKRGVHLNGVHFFWADERCVPPDDPESNFRMADELLFRPLNIWKDRVHRIRGEDGAEAAAKKAEAEILSRVAKVTVRIQTSSASQSPPIAQPVLDLILLGLGEDGHVASLFPGDSNESSAVYRPIINSPKPPPNRVTLGYPAIAAAEQVWMLASGSGKEGALRQSLSEGGKTPFARVLRSRKHTRIFTDIAV